MRNHLLLLMILSLMCISCVSFKGQNNDINITYGNINSLPKQSAYQSKPQKANKPILSVSTHSHSYIEDSKITNNNYSYNYIDINNAENILGFDIESNDDIELFIEAASWIGTPYKHAGNTKDGVDCSGLSAAIYKKLYAKVLDRRSDGQYFYNCERISNSDLKAGDLVFFKIRGNSISHVGIYLKNNLFIHASVYRGVVVNDLNETYYKKYYFAAGRVK